MVFKFLLSAKKIQSGATLVELVVVVFIISIFSAILVANFPKAQKMFSLSRSAYDLAQNLRKTEDFGLSGVIDSSVAMGGRSAELRGYGIYIPPRPAVEYYIYADIAQSADVEGDYKYSGNVDYLFCSIVLGINETPSDCIVDVVDVKAEDPDLEIVSVTDNNCATIPGDAGVSVNFNPPDPKITIKSDNDISYSAININFGLASERAASKSILVNSSGLVSVQ